MYRQLIIIFVLLTVFAVLHIFTLIMLINIKKNMAETKNQSASRSISVHSKESQPRINIITPSKSNNTVACRKCQNRFDANYSVCPKCGTIR